MEYKKIVAIGIGAIALGGIVGCTPVDPMVDPKVQAAIANAQDASYTKGLVVGKNLVDITSDNDAVVAEALKDKMTTEQVQAKLTEQKLADEQIINDYKAQLEESKAELATLTIVKTDSNGNAVENTDKYTKDELSLQTAVTETLDDSDLSFLQDTQIEFDDDDNINTHEEIKLTGVGIKTSIAENEFDDKVYMTLVENSIVYNYVFDDAVNSTLVTKDEPLYINFLGKDLEIVDISANEFTTMMGEKLLLSEGESKTISIDGKDVKVELKVVSDSNNEVSVVIDGVTKSGIAEGDVEEVGNYEVYVKSVMANEAGDVTGDFAELRIAKDVEQTFETGDEVIEDDSRWEYNIVLNADKTIASIGVVYAENSDDMNDDFPAIVEKEFVTLPNNFAKVGIELEQPKMMGFSFDFAEHNDLNMLRIQSTDSEGIVIGTDKVKKAYVNSTSIIYDNDNGDEQIKALATAKLINDNTELALGYTAPYVTIGTKLKFDVNGTFAQSGLLKDDAETTDVVYNGINYGTQEESLVTETGLVIKNIDSNSNNDKLEIEVPEEDVKATLVATK